MKRIFSGLCTIFTCAVLFFCVVPVVAHAEETSLYQAACDADGNPWSMAILVNAGGKAYAYTAYTDSRTDDKNYLYDRNNESAYEMSWVESLGDISVWQVSGYDGPSILTAAGPKKNETVTAFYITGDGDIKAVERTIADVAQVYDDGTAVIELNASISDLASEIGPGFLINTDSRCVGVVCANQNAAYVAWFDESAFGGSSGSSGGSSAGGGGAALPGVGDLSDSPWLTLALIGGAGAGVGLYLKKKKGRQSGADHVPQNQDEGQFGLYDGQFGSYGETEPPPDPPNFLNETQTVALDTGGTLFLVCSGGYMDGRIYPIDADMIMMGRDSSCAIKYPSDYIGVSRRHAILRRQNGALTLMDTSSTGTYLKRISGKIAPKQPVPVDVGDVFYLGERKNRFEIVRK